MYSWPLLLQSQPIANGTLGGEVALEMNKHRLFYYLYTIELGYTNYLHIIYVVKSSRDDLMATGGDMHIHVYVPCCMESCIVHELSL